MRITIELDETEAADFMRAVELWNRLNRCPKTTFGTASVAREALREWAHEFYESNKGEVDDE